VPEGGGVSGKITAFTAGGGIGALPSG